MLDLFAKINKKEIARLLKTDKKALEAFERAYKNCAITEPRSVGLFGMSAKDAAEGNRNIRNIDSADLASIKSRIVQELLSQAGIWKYDGEKAEEVRDLVAAPAKPVTNEEIMALPKKLRPELKGNLMKIDILEPSSMTLLELWTMYLKEKNPKKKKWFYDHFRQGLDLLDVDEITAKIIERNPNSMGHWLPQLVDAVQQQDFFRVPKTTIVKLPTTLLQMTRLEYMSHTRTTLDIVDDFCRQAFDLKEDGDYFLKTGTYSSKFDFRNAHVHEQQEVKELGEYLLFIHNQAISMASPTNIPCIYGVSTTDEWVVREAFPIAVHLLHISALR